MTSPRNREWGEVGSTALPGLEFRPASPEGWSPSVLMHCLPQRGVHPPRRRRREEMLPERAWLLRPGGAESGAALCAALSRPGARPAQPRLWEALLICMRNASGGYSKLRSGMDFPRGLSFPRCAPPAFGAPYSVPTSLLFARSLLAFSSEERLLFLLRPGNLLAALAKAEHLGLLPPRLYSSSLFCISQCYFYLWAHRHR